MKLKQDGFGVTVVLLVIVVIGLIGGTGYSVYERQQDKKERERLAQEVEELKSNNPKEKASSEPELTEDQKILVAAGCEKDSQSCTVKNKLEKIAQVTKGDDAGGINIFVAKENDEWKVVYEGNGDVPLETEEKYNIPTAWVDPDNPIDNPQE